MRLGDEAAQETPREGDDATQDEIAGDAARTAQEAKQPAHCM